MEQRTAGKRPWLAALLGAAGTGLGHLYLRRWGRALGWVAVAVVVNALFVPESALEAFATGGQVAWMQLLPLLAVSIVSTLDAYRIAVVENYLRRVRADEDVTTPCPSCGRPVDDALDFCQWCATPLSETATDGDGERPRAP